jgi:hypothetical protein
MRPRDWLAGAVFVVGFFWQCDAHQWFQQIWEPIQLWVSRHPDYASYIGPWVLMGGGLGAILISHGVPWLRANVGRKDIQIVYLNECNSEFKYAPPFKESSSPFFSGRPAPTKSMHEFSIGIHNPNSQKTLRNVRVLVECTRYGSYFDTYLICKRTGADTADISPLMTDYFLVGRGIDDSKSGMFQPVVNPQPGYLSLFHELEANAHYGFIVTGQAGRKIGLLRNNNIPLTVTAFADDVPPEVQTFVLNARERLSLYLIKRRTIISRILRRNVAPKDAQQAVP